MPTISLPQYVFCDPEIKEGKGFQKINCEHWNISNESGDCNQQCTLKNKQINIVECSRCTERKPTIQQNVSFSQSLAEQMRTKLPQHNFYDIEEIKKQNKGNTAGFIQKAMSYANAESSQFLRGKVSDEVFEMRKSHCMSCPRRVDANRDVDPIGWCGACGCGTKNPRAGLSTKLWMPQIPCPMNKFGPEKGTGFNVNDAFNSVKGAADSLKTLFRPSD